MIASTLAETRQTENREFMDWFASLRAEYALLIPGKLDEIRGVWTGLVNEKWNAEDLARFIRLTHMLAGSAGTYGYPEFGALARAVELAAKKLPADTKPNASERRETEDCLNALLEYNP